VRDVQWKGNAVKIRTYGPLTLGRNLVVVPKGAILRTVRSPIVDGGWPLVYCTVNLSETKTETLIFGLYETEDTIPDSATYIVSIRYVWYDDANPKSKMIHLFKLAS
jgi:hypothetical protein